MTEERRGRPGALFWIFGGLILIWNGFGCMAYLTDVMLSDEAYRKAYGEAMLAVRENYPAWSIAAYALAVWGGLLAALLLLLRKSWAAPLFVLSLIAAIIGFMWGFTNAEARAAAGSTFWVMPAFVIILGLLEIWWSRKKRADGTIS